MNGFGFFGAIRFIVGIAIIAVAGLAIFVATIWGELAREVNYRNRFGDQWQVEYEKDLGPVAQARTKVVLAGVGLVAIPTILVWLFRSLRTGAGQPQRTRAGKRSGRSRRESEVERIVRYRRNAIVGNYFGVAGILVGVLFSIFRWGIFADHENEILLGVTIFLIGYGGVVSGCWYWLKAKAWSGEVVFIAFMPLTVLLVPFVRVFFISNPAILIVSMIMSPLILLVVVLVLPNHSPLPKKRLAWSETKNPHHDRDAGN